jgi:hypothetical protein
VLSLPVRQGPNNNVTRLGHVPSRGGAAKVFFHGRSDRYVKFRPRNMGNEFTGKNRGKKKRRAESPAFMDKK